MMLPPCFNPCNRVVWFNGNGPVCYMNIIKDVKMPVTFRNSGPHFLNDHYRISLILCQFRINFGKISSNGFC
jgi:hypothetical protein